MGILIALGNGNKTTENIYFEYFKNVPHISP